MRLVRVKAPSLACSCPLEEAFCLDSESPWSGPSWEAMVLLLVFFLRGISKMAACSPVKSPIYVGVFSFQQPDEWAWATLLLSPILMNFSIQEAWVRNPLWFQWFDAAGLSHGGESATCFPYGFFKTELTEERGEMKPFTRWTLLSPPWISSGPAMTPL
ncbi:unnamed protein product [Prunus brigantina]